MKYDGWVLKTPKGKLLASTLGATKTDCWGNAFWIVAYEADCADYKKAKRMKQPTPESWKDRFWKRVAAAIRDAEARGYVMVRVKLTEA